MPKYLGQVIAIEADYRKAAPRRLAEAHQPLDQPAILEGLVGEYEPDADEGDRLPPEEQRVQATVEDMIRATRDVLVGLFDITAARDFTNASGSACADVVVGGQVLIEGAPVPYLLWLDAKLNELQAFTERIPTHSASTVWEQAEERGVYQSRPVRTARQVQMHKVITLAPATEHHQAQAQVVAENVKVGTWTRVKHTGSVPVARREAILRRITTLRAALHAARAEANHAEAIEPVVGARVLSYLFD